MKHHTNVARHILKVLGAAAVAVVLFACSPQKAVAQLPEQNVITPDTVSVVVEEILPDTIIMEEEIPMPVSREVKQLALDSISAPYNNWETATISGKFKMGGLPLSPSVRIYMKRDSSIFISLRAPLVGEVGRAEIADGRMLLVNKMNKTYVDESISKALAYYPGGVSDLQNLLLGRIIIPGFGLLSPDMAGSVDIYSEKDGTLTLIPQQDAMIPGFNYGYTINRNWLTEVLMVLPLNKPDVAVTLNYTHFNKGYDLEFVYQSEKRNYRATLELDPPKWEGQGFDRIKINSSYTQLSLDKFYKSF